ncbi:MAG: hypothetical protein K8F62_11740 [Pseudorhodoplanes sp.]|nr:hypothetical protein [Pseudorhodoplanes sp.]
MKKRIVIRAFTLRRDAAAALLLQKILQRKGCDVIIACSRNFSTTLRLWKPHAVVVNTVSAIRPSRKLCPNAAIVHWPGEGSEPERVCDPALLAGRPEDYEMLDRFLAWGRMTEEFCRKLLPDKGGDKVVVCGNPRLDVLKFNHDLANRDPISNSIGIVGRFNSINHYDGRPALYTLTNPENLDSVLSQCRGFVLVVQVIKHLIDTTNLHINIRPHPLEAPENYRYVRALAPNRISVDDSFDFAAWAARQRALLAPSSTSFLETYLLGVPIVNIDKLAAAKVQAHEGLAAALATEPQSFDELVTSIQTVKAQEMSREIDGHLNEAHEWYSPQSAILRAALAIIESVERKQPRVGVAWPLWLLRRIDDISYRRACVRNPLHPNFNYKEGVHRTPPYFDEIADNILKNSIAFSMTRTCDEKQRAPA